MTPDLTLDQESFFSPVIYGWRRGDRYLYIGRTRALLYRFGGHHVIGLNDLQKGDVIDVWLCDPVKLPIMESTLINLHKPMFNRAMRRRQQA